MSASLLVRLNATPERAATLGVGERLAVIQLLLDWGATGDALAILALLPITEGDEWHLVAADALCRGGRPTEGIELLEKLIARNDLFEARVLLPRCQLAAGSLRAALESAEALTALQPNRADVWTLLGDVHLGLGHPSDGELAYLSALRQEPGALPARIGLARAAEQAGDSGAALSMVREMVNASDLAAMRNDELQIVRDVAQRTGDSQLVSQIHQQLIERFERGRNRLTELLAPRQETDFRSGTRFTAPSAEEVQLTNRESAELRTAARKLFGYTAFLPLQPQIMACSRRGEDILAVLPTGGGKSLCYQLPAFMEEGGLTVVVSPLVSLMKDQVESLPPRLRTLAAALVSGGDAAGVQSILDGIAGRRFRLVYCSPERLRSRSFVSLLASAGVTRLVVDEAHCVSVWGHDFRPDYLHLQRAHADMGAPPILALTATAPPTVREDIERYLMASSRGVRPRRTLAGNPARPNLWLGAQAVSDEQDKLRRLASLSRTLVGSGIVYVRTRAQADDLAALLREQQVDAAAYHAGLDKRALVQERFMRGQVRIVVATVAFGMGIDKADIRFVLHSGVPASPEAYSQEIGRAGRDGKPATCLIVYHDRDLESAKALAQRETVDMELLYRLHGEIARRLGERRSGVLTIDETTARLGGDEIAVKVALSMLEQGKLIERHYDAPRTVRLYLRKASRGAQFQQMLKAAGLALGHPVEWGFMELSDASKIEATQLEDRLLQWQEQGFLSVYPSGRDPLVTLRAAPHDAENRIERLLRDRKGARLRRAEEIVRYINAATCRATALAAYFGRAESAPCRNCDRCGVPLTQIFR